MSTSKDSRTLIETGSRNSACKGLNTCTAAGDENLSPVVETVNAHSDHFPASCGAKIVSPVEAISVLKQEIDLWCMFSLFQFLYVDHFINETIIVLSMIRCLNIIITY